jgi:4-amino-4-deoxy-L-arabinose transferase-like glycosyltransferase
MAIWLGAFVLVAAILVLSRFTSDDPDSTLYAGIAARLAAQPVPRWIAPEWWGLWSRVDLEGLYVEHPVGFFVVPAVLARLGMPGEQAAYIFGVATALGSLLLIATIVARVATRADARAVLVLLQIMPIAFIFRVRANQEYALLLCMLVTLRGVDRARQSASGFLAVTAGIVCAFLIKGFFVIFALLAAALWVLTNPADRRGSPLRPIAALGCAVAAAAVAAAGYEVWFMRVTGESFWHRYWARQFAPDAGARIGAGVILEHALFYASRLIWHPAPWTLAAVAGLLRPRRGPRVWWHEASSPGRRAAVFVLLFAAGSVAILSPSPRVAERYVFYAVYAVAALSAVIACRAWPALRNALARLDARVPALPAVVWLGLILMRLAAGPFLPRV